MLVWRLHALPEGSWWKAVEGATHGAAILPNHVHLPNHPARFGSSKGAAGGSSSSTLNGQPHSLPPHRHRRLFPFAACHLLSSMAFAGWAPSCSWLAAFDKTSAEAMGACVCTCACAFAW